MRRNTIKLYTENLNGEVYPLLGSDGTRYLDNRFGRQRMIDEAIRHMMQIESLGKDILGVEIIFKDNHTLYIPIEHARRNQ